MTDSASRADHLSVLTPSQAARGKARLFTCGRQGCSALPKRRAAKPLALTSSLVWPSAFPSAAHCAAITLPKSCSTATATRSDTQRRGDEVLSVHVGLPPTTLVAITCVISLVAASPKRRSSGRRVASEESTQDCTAAWPALQGWSGSNAWCGARAAAFHDICAIPSLNYGHSTRKVSI